MTEIVIAILGSGVIATLVSNLFQNRRDKKRKDTGVKSGVRALLYDRIKYLCRKYIEAGEVSISDWEDLQSLHSIYHDDLGGNGFLDALMTQVSGLKMTK